MGRSIPTFFGTDGFTVGQTYVPWYRFITIVTGLCSRLAIRLLLSRTRLGIAMRAVVDHRDLAALNGARPGRTSSFAWATRHERWPRSRASSSPRSSATSRVDTLTLFIVERVRGRDHRPAPEPAADLRRRHLHRALSIAFQQNFLTWSERWSSASFAIPTMILFLALLFVPQARDRRPPDHEQGDARVSRA